MHSLRFLPIQQLRYVIFAMVMLLVCGQALSAEHIHTESTPELHCDLCVQLNTSLTTSCQQPGIIALVNAGRLEALVDNQYSSPFQSAYQSRAPPVS